MTLKVNIFTCRNSLTPSQQYQSCDLQTSPNKPTKRSLNMFGVSACYQQNKIKLMTKLKKAFIDSRLRPGIEPSLGPLWLNVTSSIKPEVHNVSQRRQRRTEPQLQGIRKPNFVTISPVVPEICSQTHRLTDKLIAILRFPTRAE